MESEATQSATLFNLLAWADAHKKQIMWGGIGVFVVGLGVGFYVWQQGAKQINASDALSQVLVGMSSTPAETAISDLNKVAADHPGTDAGARALLLSAGKSFTGGQYQQANTQFEAYLRQYRDNPFASQALLGVAACLDAEGKTNEAITAYQDLAEHHSAENVGPQAKLALARLYEAQGKFDKARDNYEDIERNDQAFGADARTRLQQLLASHPELIPAPAAAPQAGTSNFVLPKN